MRLDALRLAALAALLPAALGAAEKTARPPTEEEIRKIQEAAPADAPARPARPRKVIVWGRLTAHEPNATAAKAMEILGNKTGAFSATISEEPADLLPDALKSFDAIIMNNVHQPDPFLPADLKTRPPAEQEALLKRKETIQKAVLEFVSGGKGVAGIHAATAAFQKWPEYGEMMGGYYGGHILQEVAIKVEEPGHPLCAMFPAAGFSINDEIYIFRDPYSRAKLRVLMSLDLARMEDPAKRPDKDYAVSWVREFGKGRVFYCSLGHALASYWNPAVLRHLLAGIQFAIGDLKADSAPRPASAAAPK